MTLRSGTVRAHLQAIHGFGRVTVRSELRLADVGQPDLQIVDAAGIAIGYGETKQPGTASRFAEALESEQVTARLRG